MLEHRILADEHISKTVVSKLNAYGIETVHVTEKDLKGASDTEITRYADKDDRIILTRDEDFKRNFLERKM